MTTSASSWPLAVLGLLMWFVAAVAVFVTALSIAHQLVPRVFPEPSKIVAVIGSFLSFAGDFMARVFGRRQHQAAEEDEPRTKGRSATAPTEPVAERPLSPLPETIEAQTAVPGPEQPTTP